MDELLNDFILLSFANVILIICGIWFLVDKAIKRLSKPIEVKEKKIVVTRQLDQYDILANKIYNNKIDLKNEEVVCIISTNPSESYVAKYFAVKEIERA